MAHYTDCLTPRKEGDIGANFTDERELHIVDQNGLDEIDTYINDCTKAFFADYSNGKERDQFKVAETCRNENTQQALIPETLAMQTLKRPTYQASDIRYNHDTDFELRRHVGFDGQMHEHESDEQQDMKVDDYDDVDQNPHILKLDKDGHLKPINVVQVHNLEPNLTHQDNVLRSSFDGYEEYDPSTGGTNTRQDSNEGILRPPTNSVTDIDEETIIENHYNTIYDTQVVDQGKNRNNTKCMMKTKCRILIALLVVILPMTSVAIFVITFTHPGWSNRDHTTITIKTTHKSGNRDHTTFTTKSTHKSGSGDVKFIFVNESLAWPNAVTYCRRIHGGTLADVFINTTATSTEIPQSTSIWVGRYSTYKNWTSITVIDNNPPITIPLNSVAECQERCSNHRFIALRYRHCFCLTREPDDSEGSTECTLTCKGDATNMCGGFAAVVTVYERVSDYVQIGTVSAEDQQSCGSIENTKLIFQRNCSNSFHVLCKNYAVQQLNMFFIPGQQESIYGYFTWDKSRELCNFYNGNLVDFKAAKTLGFYPGSTWIGLFKPSKNFTVDESAVSPSSVITCTDYLNGVYRILNSHDCLGLKKPFICKIEL